MRLNGLNRRSRPSRQRLHRAWPIPGGGPPNGDSYDAESMAACGRAESSDHGTDRRLIIGSKCRSLLRSMPDDESRWTPRHPRPDAFPLRSKPFRNFTGVSPDALNINRVVDGQVSRGRPALPGSAGPPPRTGDSGWTSGTSTAQTPQSADDTRHYGTHWSSGRPVRIEPRSRSPRPASTPQPGTPPPPATCALASPQAPTHRKEDLRVTVDQPGIP